MSGIGRSFYSKIGPHLFSGRSRPCAVEFVLGIQLQDTNLEASMATLILAMLMQYVVATKAGLVNDVKGLTNVKAMQMVEANVPVRTGPTGLAELLLTPGAYLRLG